MLNRCDEHGLDSFDFFALAINPDGSHCAILYQSEAGPLTFVHLAFNYRFGRTAVDPRYYWVDTGIPESTRKLLAVISERIRVKAPLIPYGLDAGGMKFDPITGDLTLDAVGKGFTCATFVLAVLKTQSLYLLKEEEWPRDIERAWQRDVIKALEENGATREQVDATQADLGCPRFTPKEVVASSEQSVAEWPVSFERASAAARQLAGALASVS